MQRTTKRQKKSFSFTVYVTSSVFPLVQYPCHEPIHKYAMLHCTADNSSGEFSKIYTTAWNNRSDIWCLHWAIVEHVRGHCMFTVKVFQLQKFSIYISHKCLSNYSMCAFEIMFISYIPIVACNSYLSNGKKKQISSDSSVSILHCIQLTMHVCDCRNDSIHAHLSKWPKRKCCYCFNWKHFWCTGNGPEHRMDICYNFFFQFVFMITFSYTFRTNYLVIVFLLECSWFRYVFLINSNGTRRLIKYLWLSWLR